MSDQPAMSPEEAVVRTTVVLTDLLAFSAPVASAAETKALASILETLKIIAERPDMVLGPDASQKFVQHQNKEKASLLYVLQNTVIEQAHILDAAVKTSSEMGWDMLSQKGMISAFRWVSELLKAVAVDLAPDLKVDRVDIEEYRKGREKDGPPPAQI